MKEEKQQLIPKKYKKTQQKNQKIREYNELLYVSKFTSPEEMDKFLETCSSPKLSQEKIDTTFKD